MSAVPRTFTGMTFGRTRVAELLHPLTDHKCEMTVGITVEHVYPTVGMSLDAFRDHFLSCVRPGAVFTRAPPTVATPVMIDCAPVMASRRSLDRATIAKPWDSKVDGSPPRVNPPAIFPAAVQVSTM